MYTKSFTAKRRQHCDACQGSIERGEQITVYFQTDPHLDQDAPVVARKHTHLPDCDSAIEPLEPYHDGYGYPDWYVYEHLT